MRALDAQIINLDYGYMGRVVSYGSGQPHYTPWLIGDSFEDVALELLKTYGDGAREFESYLWDAIG